jgi:hypothetical protein
LIKDVKLSQVTFKMLKLINELTSNRWSDCGSVSFKNLLEIFIAWDMRFFVNMNEWMMMRNYISEHTMNFTLIRVERRKRNLWICFNLVYEKFKLFCWTKANIRVKNLLSLFCLCRSLEFLNRLKRQPGELYARRRWSKRKFMYRKVRML